MKRRVFPRFRFDVDCDRVIFVAGPVGFIGMNTWDWMGGLLGVCWGTTTLWLEVPGGAWELSLGEPLFGPRDPDAPPLFAFYPDF